ncbi:NAD(P)/FAD-dependent oxidoreductase [Myroides odoratus]|uniref:NAD(P)/FAD-dependent oxidoreductase n=1 Tax=Myroides odoratus TaxID=256 RepID=UPI0007660957|nr:NAD(P)/FAD-dependent oxidoreductase [Myroides odoratus]
MIYKEQYDVIIVGGSYAGLSAAMALGRLLKSVLILDSGLPCNRQTPHSHNFITQDGQTPAAILAKAKAQVLAYKTVSFYEGLALSAQQTGEGFEITTATQHTFSSKKLIFATGIQDHLPAIPGLSTCWGISVIHCPYCHGYEFQNKRTAILAHSDKALHLVSLVKNLTPHITLATHGGPAFSQEQRNKLEQNKISIIADPVIAIEHDQGHVQAIIFQNNSKLDVEAVYAAVPFEQHCSLPFDLGCERTESGHIKVDAFQKTTIEGIYACGDNTTPFRSVAAAVASGSLAGAMVVKELTDALF